MSETLHTEGKLEVVKQYTEICLDAVDSGREICRCEMADDRDKADFARLAHCWNNYDDLEMDRNRWRSVAEQAEKFARFQKENGAVGPVGKRLMDEALAGFDSLRKEEG